MARGIEKLEKSFKKVINQTFQQVLGRTIDSFENKAKTKMTALARSIDCNCRWTFVIEKNIKLDEEDNLDFLDNGHRKRGATTGIWNTNTLSV